MDATQSRLKGLLMKAKRYVIPFDKRKLAMQYVVVGIGDGCNRFLFHTVRFLFTSSLPWCCGSHGDAALPGTDKAHDIKIECQLCIF